MKDKNKYSIITINPGSTSTKIGYFENEKEIFIETVRHSSKELEIYPSIWEQYSYRKMEILAKLKEFKVDLANVSAIVGRGGLIRPIASGVYTIDENMIDDARIGYQGHHASNLGCVIAYGIGWEYGVPSFIVDPPAVDDFEAVARISGNAAICSMR